MIEEIFIIDNHDLENKKFWFLFFETVPMPKSVGGCNCKLKNKTFCVN